MLDIGTGTGRLLELLAPRIQSGIGIDASRAMLALARARLSQPQTAHCSVRLADMYRLPLADASCDLVVLQMLLHHAEDPASVLLEAARVLRPAGRLIIVDLAAHDHADAVQRLAHRWPGFSDSAMHDLMAAAALAPAHILSVPGPIEVRLWSATPAIPALPPEEVSV